jgi:hypothetical protein
MNWRPGSIARRGGGIESAAPQRQIDFDSRWKKWFGKLLTHQNMV